MLLTVGLAGCLGGEDDGGESELKSQATVEEDTGGIQGVVTDAAVQPISGAEITLTEISERTQTASDGSFAFSNVVPGTYTLQVQAEGFIGTEEEVTVRAGQVATVDVVIAHEPSLQPFSEQFEFTGFVECSVSTPVVGVAVCAIPNFFLGGNATNDRFLIPFELQPDPWQMVVEVEWDPTQPLGTNLVAIVEPDGLPNDDRTEFGDEEGESPLRVVTDRERFKEVDKNTTMICDGEGDDPGSFAANREEYCNRNYIAEGGPAWVRLFVEEPDPIPVGLAVQQEYHLIISIFYHAPACEDYSVFEDNACPQEETARPESLNGTQGNETGNQSNESGGGGGLQAPAPGETAPLPDVLWDPRARAR